MTRRMRLSRNQPSVVESERAIATRLMGASRGKCADCGIRANLDPSTGLCITAPVGSVSCYDAAGEENAHSDGHHRDQPSPWCPICSNDATAATLKLQPPVAVPAVDYLPGSLTVEEQMTLLDIVTRYYKGDASPNAAMAWVFGLVSNSQLNDGRLS